MRLHQIIHDDALNFFHSPQTTIVPVKTYTLIADSRGKLYRIRRAEMVAGTQFSGLVNQVHRQRNPLNLRIGAAQGKNLLCQFLLLVVIRLNQELEKSHDRSNCRILPPFNKIEGGCTPSSTSRVVFKKIDEDVGGKTNALMLGRKAL